MQCLVSQVPQCSNVYLFGELDRGQVNYGTAFVTKMPSFNKEPSNPIEANDVFCGDTPIKQESPNIENAAIVKDMKNDILSQVASITQLEELYNQILQAEVRPIVGIELLIVGCQLDFDIVSLLVKLGFYAIIRKGITYNHYWTRLETSGEFELLQRVNFLSDVAPDTFIVITPTYDRRPKRQTLPLLKRCIDTVKNQSYSNFVHIIIGDHYVDDAEFDGATTTEDSQRLISINLPFAREREIWKVTDFREMWHNAGANTINYGVWLASQAEARLARLDDDDVWTSNHLQVLDEQYRQLDCSFVFTCNWSKRFEEDPDCPRPGALYHSSTSWRPSCIPLRYKSKKGYPADAYMWIRIRNYIKQNNLLSKRIYLDTVIYDRTNEIILNKMKLSCFCEYLSSI